jgi:coenzyme F420-reducing hydrogenase beta subunit
MKMLKRKANPLVMTLMLLGAGAVLGYLAIGAGNPKSLLVSMRVETNKAEYVVGENVAISLYFVNGQDTAITVDTLSYQLEISGVDFVFGMDRSEMREDTVTIPPSSERLIDSYTWDQKDFDGIQVSTGVYTICASLLDYVLEGETTFQIW